MANRIYDREKPDVDGDESFFKPVGNPGDDKFNKIIDDNFKAGEEAQAEKSAVLGDDEGVGGFMQQAQDASQDESENLNGFFNNINEEDTAMRGPGKKIRAAVRRKRNLIVLGAIGTILPIVGGFIALPYQLTHFSELLQQFHFSINEDVGASRTTRLIRYLKYPDKPQNRRLSIIGNNIADKVELKLSNSGFVPIYDDGPGGSGYLQGFEVDQNNSRAIQDLANDGLQQADTPGNDGRVRMNFTDVDAEGRFNSRGRRVGTRAVFKAAGYGKLSRLHSRVLIKRGGVTFKPLGDLSRDKRQSLADRIRTSRDERSERRRTGVADAPSLVSETNQDGTPKTEEQLAADEAEARRNNSNNNTPDGSSSDSLKTARSRFLGSALAGVGGVGLLCTVRQLDEQADELKWVNRALPMMRIGVDLVAAGDQIKSGNGFTAEEVGVWTQDIQEVATLATGYEADGETPILEDIGPWTNAKSIRAELGQEGGVDIPESARVSERNDLLSKIGGSLGFIPNNVCSVATNPYFGAFVTVATLGAASLGDFVLDGIILGAGALWMDDLIRIWAGIEVDTDPKGANYGNLGNHGTMLGSNEQAISFGGTELTAAQSAEVDARRDANIAYENSQKSVFDRYLSPQNPRSFASLAAFTMPSGITGFATTIAQSPLTGLRGLFAPASAQESYDYGFPRFGFAVGELESLDVQNPYENSAILDSSIDIQDLHDTIGEPCFGIIMKESQRGGDPGTLDFSESTQYWGENGLLENCEKAKSKARDELGMTNDLFTRYRFYLVDNMLMTSLACYENFDQFCEELGFGNSTEGRQASASDQIIGDAYAPSEDIPCDSRTNDLGVHEAYIGGQPIPARLCGIPNISSTSSESAPGNSWYVEGADGNAIVNSRVSGAWFALAEAAEQNGTPLSATSSFRTHAHQISLCNGNAGCRTGTSNAGVATPGYSGHQAGVAIDMANMRGPGVLRSANCTTNRATHNSDTYRFLVENASKYGLRQYAAEAWHWDALSTASRCTDGEGT